MLLTVLAAFLSTLALLGGLIADTLAPMAQLIPRFNQGMAVIAAVAAISTWTLILRFLRTESKDRELKMTLETSNIKLTQLDKLKSEFLSFASHQIKAPMTVVKGYATLITDGSLGDASDRITDTAGKIKDSADRMISLVNLFLDFRRIDEGKMQYRVQPTDLAKLCVSVADGLRQLASRKGLTLTVAIPDGSWTAPADEEQLSHVLQNLIDNAIKYTDAGTVTLKLARAENGALRISVSDTGRGISHELAPRLFEQFSRDQSIAKEIAGTGLGLYIARRIVEAHHGRIWASSDGPGKGSVFTIELPSR